MVEHSNRGSAPDPASPRTGPDGPAATPAQSLVRPSAEAEGEGERPHEQGEGAAAPASAGNSSEHVPEDIRWAEGRDPARFWAVTRRQPVASLLVAGLLWGFSRSVPPPAPLIGRRLIVTAGGDHHPFKQAGRSGEDAVFDYCGVAVSIAEIPSGRARMFREAVHTLPASQSVGAVRLAAAFQIANVIDDVVYADVRQGGAYSAPRQMGIWQEFDKRQIARVEDLQRGRWMWCFDAAHEFDLDRRVKLKGFGGVWDYEKGLRLRGAL